MCERQERNKRRKERKERKGRKERKKWREPIEIQFKKELRKGIMVG